MEQIFEFLILLGNMSKFYTKLENVRNFRQPAIFPKKIENSKICSIDFQIPYRGATKQILSFLVSFLKKNCDLINVEYQGSFKVVVTNPPINEAEKVIIKKRENDKILFFIIIVLYITIL